MVDEEPVSNPIRAVAAIACVWIALAALTGFLTTCGFIDMVSRW
jgi:hypothetical protein